MLEDTVKNDLMQYLENTGKDYIDFEQLEEIFSHDELEISDEDGWHGIDAIWVEDGEFYASYTDEDGEEDTDVIVFTNDELIRLNKWLKRNIV